MKNENIPDSLLNEAFRCKPNDLESLLRKIELEIKEGNHVDEALLRAKIVVTTRMASYGINVLKKSQIGK